LAARTELAILDCNISGFSADAVTWLLGERGISGLGTECADIELPWKTKQAVKLELANNNRFSVVQVRDVGQVL